MRTKEERRRLHQNDIRTSVNQTEISSRNGSRVFKCGKYLYEEKKVNGQSFYRKLTEKLEG